MSLNKRTFVGFYRVKPTGIIPILFRDEITVPKSEVIVGDNEPITIEDLVTKISTIVEENELAPVTELNEDFSDELETVLTSIQETSTEEDTVIAIKFALEQPSSGDNKGAVLLITNTRDKAGSTSIFLTAQEMDPLAPSPGPSPTPGSAPNSFTAEQWSVSQDGSDMTITITDLPNNNGSDILQVKVHLLWAGDGEDFKTLSSAEPGVFTVSGLSTGISYSVTLIANNTHGDSEDSDIKAFELIG